MISATVKVELDGVFSTLSHGKENVLKAVTEQALNDSNRYIPKQDGPLEFSSISHSRIDEGLLVWDTPYAKRLYYNPQYNFSKDVNPNARGLWFEHAEAMHMREWEQVGQRGFLKW